MKNNIEKAYELAKIVHKDEKRADGRPYIVHIDLVKRILEYWMAQKPYVISEFTIILGIVHDIKESNPNIDLSEFGNSLVAAAEKLNNTKFNTYLEYLLDLREYFWIDIILVKRADVIANYYDALYFPATNKHQAKHLKNKVEMAFYILFEEKIWERPELQLIKEGKI